MDFKLSSKYIFICFLRVPDVEVRWGPDLTFICPQREVNDHPSSLGVILGVICYQIL